MYFNDDGLYLKLKIDANAKKVKFKNMNAMLPA